MGYNTTVVIYNDCLDMIRDDPDFGKNLVNAILKTGCYNKPSSLGARGKSCSGNVGVVVESHHADETVHVAVGQNYGEVVR